MHRRAGPWSLQRVPLMSNHMHDVMAGPVPAIHAFAALRGSKDVDARDTSAFTRVFDALCAGMTA